MVAAASVNIRGVEGGSRRAYDFADPAQALEAMVKMRGDLSGAETAWYWTGSIWGMVPGEGNRKLFAYDGFSMARFEASDAGYRMLNREVGLYRDPATGDILDHWLNPYLGREVAVLHRFNDHVNAEIRREGGFSIARVPVTELGDDLFWTLDMFFFRPSPISRADYPLNVQHDMYQGAELTLYHARAGDIGDPGRTGAPARVTFSRISQWEPFMEMGNRPGQLVFHAAGRKLDGGAAGLEALDPRMHRLLAGDHPEYLHAPKTWQPGTVSQWDAFKALREPKTAG